MRSCLEGEEAGEGLFTPGPSPIVWSARIIRRTTLFGSSAGLSELQRHIADGHLAVLFRNNHFATVTRHEGVLYQLATDSGYTNYPNVVWERLTSVCDGLASVRPRLNRRRRGEGKQGVGRRF